MGTPSLVAAAYTAPMKIAMAVGLVLLGACSAEKKTTTETTTAPETVARVITESEPAPATDTTATEENPNRVSATFRGEVRMDQPVSMFNYVGQESGDFAPIRFRNDSPEGQKILAVCADSDECEFTGVVEWLDETPPENASAIGQLISVESVKRIPGENESRAK